MTDEMSCGLSPNHTQFKENAHMWNVDHEKYPQRVPVSNHNLVYHPFYFYRLSQVMLWLVPWPIASSKLCKMNAVWHMAAYFTPYALKFARLRNAKMVLTHLLHRRYVSLWLLVTRYCIWCIQVYLSLPVVCDSRQCYWHHNTFSCK